MYYSTRQNKRTGEEHGSARWGNVHALNRRYRDKKPENNVILTQHLQMGLDGRKHRRNLLQVIVGGSGAGKTRFVIKPNIYLRTTSYIVTDPKGEVTRAVVPLLLRKGYEVRILTLSTRRNRIITIHSTTFGKDADVFRLIDNFIKTPRRKTLTTPPAL